MIRCHRVVLSFTAGGGGGICCSLVVLHRSSRLFRCVRFWLEFSGGFLVRLLVFCVYVL